MERSFDGPALELMYSTDYSGSGDPNNATWTAVSGYESSDADGEWYSDITMDISDISGSNVYFAFHYTSTTESSSRYNLDNFEVKGN